MRHFWPGLAITLVIGLLASTLEAQRFPQVMNLNTHEGKYSTGGFGIGLGGGFGFGGKFEREAPDSDIIGGDLESVFSRRKNQDFGQSRTVFGVDIDFQVGSDNSVIGTDFGLEIYSMAISGSDSGTDISKSATLGYLGFDFTIELYSSEFLETDGRRSREKWGLALLVGPKVGYLMGDFSDLNGLASIGLDFGLMADIPIPFSGAEDLFSISPYLFVEANYRFAVDNDFVDADVTSPTFGQKVLNDNFDESFYFDTIYDRNGDGLIDETDDDRFGVAIRRHNFIPAYQLNLGVDFNLTPIFISRSGGIINNWRFRFSFVASAPFSVKLFGAQYVGDSMWSSTGEVPITFSVVLGATYFF